MVQKRTIGFHGPLGAYRLKYTDEERGGLMDYGTEHECEAMKNKKKYLVSSVPLIRRKQRKDGGRCVLELRVRDGDFDCMETVITYCPYCGENLVEVT